MIVSEYFVGNFIFQKLELICLPAIKDCYGLHTVK